ncbi:HAMP domain-containing sensor histidine kinase [Mucilaginibacter terrae]|uniref:histidine kinase n=1 Tax=Mucilaginibacter terrae TaxID=1955052 RepID=A0ABU3GUE2_9SPHI|nr:HAMP domain-containing sensor histidine kinase [Mucilaginibacter terrae]MDT3403395.1 signal transduction histidine kinase [Mucilaginibacter terrae]
MKIQSKITLLFLILSTGILLLLNAFILYFDYQFNYDDFFKRLEARVNLTAETRLFPGERSRAYEEVRKKYLEKLDHETEYILKADASGSFKRDGFPSEFIDEIISTGKSRYKQKNKFLSGKVVALLPDKYIVIVSARNPYGMRELKELQKILLVGFIGSLVIAFFVGKAFSFYTFTPIRKLTDRVKMITSDNLHLRLDEPTGKDEISELSLTFNNMLNRLETAFDTQNNFVSNASHELRTPLTVVNSEVEIALTKTDLTAEQRSVLNTISSETDKLIQILNNLLLLAQSGFDGKKQRWQIIRIDELIWMAIESLKKIQPDSNIEVDFSQLPENEELLQTSGNSNLLRLAISNIISNACKYSQNQLVKVKLTVQNKQISITVTDVGIGIPHEDLEHIFEPFYRASNTLAYAGHGVGLPLTLNIIRLHKGTIDIRSKEDSGTEIQVLLPIVNSN